MTEPMPSSSPVPRTMGDGGGHEPANLADILERVLDKGLVIAGDIRVSLLDIELLTIKLRLLIASVDTARELGINWWESDPWLRSEHHELLEENRELRKRLAVLEDSDDSVDSVESGESGESVAELEQTSRNRRSSRRSSDG